MKPQQQEIPVHFTVGDQQLIGMLHLPGPAPVPGVVFFHGFTGSKHEVHRLFVSAARRLAACGIAALRFDFRGAGDSAGEFQDLCISTMLADARAAWNFLAARSEINPRALGVLGYSLGGLVAQLFLGETPEVRAAVLWSPVCDPQAAVARKATAANTTQLAVRGMVDMDGWPVGRRLILEMQKARPLTAVSNTSAAVLLLHGEKDETVPPQDSAQCEQALVRAGAKVKRQLIAGAGHTFDALPLQEQLLEATLRWFTTHLLA